MLGRWHSMIHCTGTRCCQCLWKLRNNKSMSTISCKLHRTEKSHEALLCPSTNAFLVKVDEITLNLNKHAKLEQLCLFFCSRVHLVLRNESSIDDLPIMWNMDIFQTWINQNRRTRVHKTCTDAAKYLKYLIFNETSFITTLNNKTRSV